MRFVLLLPAALLSLAGCVRADTSPTPAQTSSTTVVTPAPSTALMAPPATTTTVVRSP